MRQFLSVCAFLALIVPAMAADTGIYKNMTHITLLGGAAVPGSQYNNKNITGEKLAYGDVGVGYGVQITTFLTSHIGIGLEFSAADYFSKTSGLSGQDYKTSADRYNLMLTGRYTFAPEARTRFYIPIGAGVARFKAKLENAVTGNLDYVSNKPAFYVGAGIETDLCKLFFIGMEARYNAFWVEKDQFYGNADYLQDINFLLKIGLKF